ncbi:MAG: hypothetical protein KIT87_27455 [Anaerolineae bacterium]|nr:hypothetical protein [Anaerolineae bacterium]
MTLEHLLDLCLAQLNTGDKDLAAVLAQYPEHRAALEPMLRAALAVRQAPVAQPRSEARVAGKERLLAALLARLPAEALDHALALLKSGQPLEQALADTPYPNELKPLLRLAQAIEQTPEPRASLEAQAIGYARLIAAVEARRRELDVLDQAVAQVQAGETVEAVVAEAGPAAASLAPALRAVAAVQAVPEPTPRPAAKAAGLAQLQAALHERQRVESILDRALNDLRNGFALEAVLARYPLYARALEPLLRTALAVEATPEPALRPEAKAAAWARLQAAVVQKREFEQVLDQALADLRAGRADIPMLLARYRPYAAQLEPMLLSAYLALSAPPREPRPRAVAEGRTRLMEAVAAKRAHLVAEKLDQAIGRVQAGASIETVLAAEPGFRAELEPLLRTAITVQQTPLPAVRQQARQAGEHRLVQAARARRHAAVRPVWAALWALVSTFNAPRGPLRQVFIGAMALLLFVSSSLVGVTRAAATSLPDDTLYPVKLVAEQVQLALAPSPEARAQLHLAFAQERLREVQAAVEAGRSPARAIAQLPRHTDSAADAVGLMSPEQRDAYTRQLQQVRDNEKAVLEQVRGKVSADIQNVIVGIVGTPTAIIVVQVPILPTATWTPLPATATALPSKTPTSGENGGVPPTKTPLPPPINTASAPTVVAPTQAPVLAPTHTSPPPVPTEIIPPTSTPPLVAIAPTRIPQVGSNGSQPTRAPQVTATSPAQDTPAPSETGRPTPPVQTATPAPTATPIPATPEPTVIVAPTRGLPPTRTPPPPTATAPPPTAVPATATSAPPAPTATSQPTQPAPTVGATATSAPSASTPRPTATAAAP